MVADASIYSLIKPVAAAPGPLDQYGQAMTLKNLMGQGDLHEIQKRGLLRDEQTGEQLRGLFGRNPSPTDAEVMAIDPLKAGPAYLKQKREGVKADADLQKVDRENFIALADASRKSLSTMTPQTWPAYRDGAIQAAAMFKTPEIRALAMKAAEAMPTQFDQNYIRNSLVKAEDLFTPKPVERTDGQRKWMEDTNPFTNPGILTRAPTQMQQTPESVASNATTRRGQDLTNTRAIEAAEAGRWTNDLANGVQVNSSTGETRPITKDGQPIQRDPKLTEDQGKATGWLVQADNAYKNIIKVMDGSKGKFLDPSKPGVPDALAAIPSFGATEGIANVMRTGDRQKFIQASSSLSEALLRAATGAGVNKDEAAQKVKELTPQIGDGDDVRKQKLEAIPLYIESLKVRAGPGAAQLPGIRERGAPAAPPTQEDIDAELRRRKVIQ